MKTVIKASGLHKKYELGKDNFVHALRGASVAVGSGEMIAIMGPSGSGKSTLMHMLGCLDRPDQGEVWLLNQRVDNMGGRELTRLRSQKIGFIFQGFNLIPTLTALENVALAAEYAGVSRKPALSLAADALDRVDLADRREHHPSELSGGQQQRVAIARALVNQPAIILGDEPTGDLDTASSDEIVKMMQEINRATGTTFVLVTHNPEVGRACGRIIHMRDGVVTEG